MWGTPTDASTWGSIAPIWGHRVLTTEPAPTVSALGAGMAEEVLLELVAPHGAAADPTWGHLALSLLSLGPLDPTRGRRLK